MANNKLLQMFVAKRYTKKKNCQRTGNAKVFPFSYFQVLYFILFAGCLGVDLNLFDA